MPWPSPSGIATTAVSADTGTANGTAANVVVGTVYTFEQLVVDLDTNNDVQILNGAIMGGAHNDIRRATGSITDHTIVLASAR